jgi:hypothetical protein
MRSAPQQEGVVGLSLIGFDLPFLSRAIRGLWPCPNISVRVRSI